MSATITTTFQTLWNSAWEAGRKAAAATTPTPMFVYEADGLTSEPKPGGQSWHVPQGPCGFGWINIRPANSKFANWLRKEGIGRTDSYEGGLRIPVFEHGQSYEKKAAHAYAVADFLRENGVTAYGNARLD